MLNYTHPSTFSYVEYQQDPSQQNHILDTYFFTAI